MQTSYDKRGVCAYLKDERRACYRCNHNGFFKDIMIDGDYAIASVFLRGHVLPLEYEPTPENFSKKITWSRYTLKFIKKCGEWKIINLLWTPGVVEH